MDITGQWSPSEARGQKKAPIICKKTATNTSLLHFWCNLDSEWPICLVALMLGHLNLYPQSSPQLKRDHSVTINTRQLWPTFCCCFLFLPPPRRRSVGWFVPQQHDGKSYRRTSVKVLRFSGGFIWNVQGRLEEAIRFWWWFGSRNPLKDPWPGLCSLSACLVLYCFR